MMSEDNHCSLDGLDEEFRMLDTNEQLPPGGFEEKKMEGDGGERSLDASDNKNKLTIEWLPAELLAICLLYTGKDLPNARLSCRRFNQIIEDYQYMMKYVIPVDMLDINKEKCQDFSSIRLVTLKWKIFNETTCKLDELMQYVRFFRPRYLYIGEHLEATDMKNYLTDSWRKGIVKLDSYEPLLSVFPNVSELKSRYYDLSDLPLLSAQISAHPSPIRRFTLESYIFRDLDKNDLILDALSKNSNKFNGGMEYFGCFNASCSMEAIIRFLENGKFAKKFCMFARVKNYNDRVGGNDVYVENCGYLKFKIWMRSKRIPQPCDGLWTFGLTTKFVYRSTQFELQFENC